MKTKINILNSEGNIISTFIISFFERWEKKQQLDAQTFYLAYAKVIHDVTVEMRIDAVIPFSFEDMLAKKAHIHKGNDEKWYICYPSRVSKEKAMQIAMHWCVITTFHMQYQADIAWFESFDRWITKKRATDGAISAFDGFMLWICDIQGWNIEVIGSEKERIIKHTTKNLLRSIGKEG